MKVSTVEPDSGSILASVVEILEDCMEQETHQPLILW